MRILDIPENQEGKRRRKLQRRDPQERDFRMKPASGKREQLPSAKEETEETHLAIYKRQSSRKRKR